MEVGSERPLPSSSRVALSACSQHSAQLPSRPVTCTSSSHAAWQAVQSFSQRCGQFAEARSVNDLAVPTPGDALQQNTGRGLLVFWTAGLAVGRILLRLSEQVVYSKLCCWHRIKMSILNRRFVLSLSLLTIEHALCHEKFFLPFLESLGT